MPFNKKNPTDAIKVRPRFKLHSTLNEEGVFDHILKKLDNDKTVVARKRFNKLDITLPANELHYWSPELHVIIEKSDFKEGTCLICMLGPQHNVWLTFVATYTIIGLFTFFGGMFALVKLQLGNPGLWLLLFPLAAFLVSGVYIISFFGKKKGHQQSVHLLRFLYASIDDSEILRR